MKNRIHLYVSRKNALTWLMALCMVCSAVARIALSGLKGSGDAHFVWSQIVLPIAAALLYALIALLSGKEQFYKTAIPVWLMALYAGLTFSVGVSSRLMAFLFWVAVIFFAFLYTDITAGRRKHAVLLLFPILCCPLLFLMYCYRAFLLQHDYYAGGKCLPDFLMVLGMLILLFGIRVHPVDEYHPTWGDRTDGRRLRTLPPMAQVSPYIMIPADTSYVGNALPPAGELIPHFLKNLRSYYSLVLSDFKPFWLIAAVLAVIAFCVRVVLDSRRKTVPAIAMTAAALVLMGLMCFGLYPALAATVFAPRAMYGFGVLLTVFGMTAAEGKKRFSLKIPAVVLSWVFFVFAFTYGNALSVQKDYTDFRTQLVISDLQEMEAFQSDTPVTVQLSGSIGNAPVLRNMPQNYQMLNRLIPGTFGGGDDLTQYGFYCYYGMRNVVWNPDVDLREMDLPVVEDNMYHTIRGEGSYVLVELK